jgi:zinc transporter ZupT
MDYLFNKNIDPYFWQSGKLPDNSSRFQGWIYGVLGAVIAGWGTLIAFWAYYPFKTRERWAWKGLALAIAVWYIADTIISAMYGVIFNVVFNTIMLFLLASPLVLTRKFFLK